MFGAHEATRNPEDFVPIGKVDAARVDGGTARLQVGDATVEVRALASDVFRIGMFLEGRPPEYDSEAITAATWDDLPVQTEETGEVITLQTGAATAHISLNPLRIRFDDSTGRTFAADDPDLGMGYFKPVPGGGVSSSIGPAVRLHKMHDEGTRYFGCGERTGGLEKTGSHQVFWNFDPPPGHGPGHNNLYMSIPFLLSLRDGQAWGLFFANPSNVEFDLAWQDPQCSWFGAANGDLIYYVFCGPSIRSVVDRYTRLTGRTPMPPIWSLGYHQSRYSYMDADELLSVARQMRARRIPCDVLYLDIHYMDGYRVFTWDRERFPDPEGTIAALREMGFRLVTIIDPGVKVDESYPVYVEGRDRQYFCAGSRGLEYRNVVWPGLCAFPDFSQSAVRRWWGEQYRALLDTGVAGIWCDMDEPALFIPLPSTMPDDVVHRGDDTPKLHGQIHNLYGSLMARATREGLLSLRPEERPFVISRSGFAGMQRNALHWTGDNSSWWEHLRLAMPQLQNLGLSGLAWAGVDVGGFNGDTTGELLTRWVEFGIFQPFCRNHSGLGTRHQEPWSFGEPYESHIRNLLQLRQKLIPYLYTLFEECHRNGAPILRPLLFEFPDDESTYTLDDEFLLGSSLLVAPVTQPGHQYRHVYLPQGTWFHFWSDERFQGPAHVLARVPLGKPAVYVKGNVPIPLWPDMNFVDERARDPLTIRLYPVEGNASTSLYEDDGNGFAYQQGLFSRREITCTKTGADIRVRLGAVEGSYRPGRTMIRIELCGLDAPPSTVRSNGASVQSEYDSERRVLAVPLGETSSQIDLDIQLVKES